LQQKNTRKSEGSSWLKISDSVTMFIYSGYQSGSTGMKRFPLFVGLAFLLLLIQVGIASADSPSINTTTVTTTTTPERTGGSVFIDTYPTGATIWLDNIEIGTSPLTYYSEKIGTLDLLIQKKRYENYTGTVTVGEGKRVVLNIDLTPVSRETTYGDTPVQPVTTATTMRKSTITVPTSWPTSPESPVDPAVVIGATAIVIGMFVIRRR
jgi:hypothetical protein